MLSTEALAHIYSELRGEVDLLVDETEHGTCASHISILLHFVSEQGPNVQRRFERIVGQQICIGDYPSWAKEDKCNSPKSS